MAERRKDDPKYGRKRRKSYDPRDCPICGCVFRLNKSHVTCEKQSCKREHKDRKMKAYRNNPERKKRQKFLSRRSYLESKARKSGSRENRGQ